MIRRLYAPENTPKLITFGRKMHAKYKQPFPFSEARCKKLLACSYMAADRAVWGAFDGKQVVGVLIASVEPFGHLDADYVTDLIFVAERDGAALYHAMVNWGKAHGAKAVQVGVSTGDPAGDKFYEAEGLRRMGSVWFKEV